WEAVRRLKNDPQTQDIPIIGMSAYAAESEREKAIATGGDEVDAKPIEFESLVATIGRVLTPRKQMFRPCWPGWRPPPHPHHQPRTLDLFACHGHIAAHHARELAGDGKAETRAAEVLRGRGISLGELPE